MDIDLLHTRVNGDRHANGVIGGHTPASPVDRDHPLWRLNGGPASKSSTAGRSVESACSAQARWAFAVPLVWFCRVHHGTSRWSRSESRKRCRINCPAHRFLLRCRVRQVHAPRSCWRDGAGTNGTSGVTGMSGTSSGANGTGSSAASGRSQGTGSFMGAGGSGAGGKKDEKKAQRRHYTPFRFEDDEDELPEAT